MDSCWSRIAMVAAAWVALHASCRHPDHSVTASGPVASDAQRTMVALELLALKLKGRRLGPDEMAQASQALQTSRPEVVYRQFVERWLDLDGLSRVGNALVSPDGTTASLFVDHLAVYRGDDSHKLYYLHHRADGSAAPCRPDQAVMISPWWDLNTSIAICKQSYLPDHVFDTVGYCGGQAEPTVPAAPRAECGCGPFLLGCLPPDDEAPELVQRMDRDAHDEVAHTAAVLIQNGASYKDLITTTATWQTGLIQFLYARREIIGWLAHRKYDAQVESEIRDKLARLDLEAAGAMTERPPPYTHSGLFVGTISSALTAAATYRSVSGGLLVRELCRMVPQSVTVRADALLLVTATTPNLRLKDVHLSPMRHQDGCRDCHNPMDGTSAFLLPLATPLFGSMPTGRAEQASLVVNGAGDTRGSGVGLGDLMELVAQQPEFLPCTLERFFTYFVGRPPSGPELATLQEEQSTHAARLKDLIRAILVGDAFTRGVLR
jgi:hypothetical protein